jgi:hypothetical protein
MKPSIGSLLIVVGLYARSNGADVAPGVVTRVWSDDVVNVTVLPDCKAPQPATSVKIYDGEEAARAAVEAGESSAAYWPPTP